MTRWIAHHGVYPRPTNYSFILVTPPVLAVHSPRHLDIINTHVSAEIDIAQRPFKCVHSHPNAASVIEHRVEHIECNAR